MSEEFVNLWVSVYWWNEHSRHGCETRLHMQLLTLLVCHQSKHVRSTTEPSSIHLHNHTRHVNVVSCNNIFIAGF